MKKLTRMLTLILSLLLLASSVFCQSGLAEEAKEPITFKLLMTNWATWDEPMDADPVGRWITEQTGVTLDVELITGEANERYALALATGDLPDFLMWTDDAMMSKFVSAGYLVKLDDYLDRMPNMVSMYGDNLNAIRYIGDGNLYSLRQWYMGSSKVVDNALQLNHKFVQEYLGENVANEPGTILLSDLETAMLAYKADHPTNANGETVYPLVNMNTSLLMCAFGIDPWFETSEDHVEPYYMHPDFPELVKLVNRWYNEGILDPEFSISKTENWQQKLTSMASIAFFGHESQTAQPNMALMEEDPESYMMYYRTAFEEGKDRWRYMSTIGAPALTLTTACKNTDRAIEFMDFMCRPDTNYYCCNGLENGVWKYDENGKVELIRDKWEATPELWDRFRKYGAYKYIFALCEGPDDRWPAYDGNTYEILHAGGGSDQVYTKGRYHFFDVDALVNPAQFVNIDPDAGSDAAIVMTRLQETWDYAWPSIVMAGSEDEAVKIYESTIQDMKDSGLETYANAVSEKYFIKKAMLSK